MNKGLLFYNQSQDALSLPLFEDVAENYPATEEAKEALPFREKLEIAQAGHMYRAGDGGEWVRAGSEEGVAIVAAIREKCAGKQLKPCNPK